MLRECSVLKGKEFPEKTDRKVWAAAMNELQHGALGVTMCAAFGLSIHKVVVTKNGSRSTNPSKNGYETALPRTVIMMTQRIDPSK
jgi:hypothetical protein